MLVLSDIGVHLPWYTRSAFLLLRAGRPSWSPSIRATLSVSAIMIDRARY